MAENKNIHSRKFLNKTVLTLIAIIFFESFTTSSNFNRNSELMNALVSASVEELDLRLEHGMKDKILKTIIEASRENNLDPLVVICVINIESSFRIKAVSKKGAVGLMQVLPSVSRSLAVEIGRTGEFDLSDPHLNIFFGTYYLAKLINIFDDLNTAILAYNYGPTRVSNWLVSGEKIPKQYVRKIKDCYTRVAVLK
ncbi:MAG TPA: lytic transglycosylase domain-containing protein [bacterium]